MKENFVVKSIRTIFVGNVITLISFIDAAPTIIDERPSGKLISPHKSE